MRLARTGREEDAAVKVRADEPETIQERGCGAKGREFETLVVLRTEMRLESDNARGSKANEIAGGSVSRGKT